MDDLNRLFSDNRPTTLTFDCYGTLVDWEGGAVKALRSIYGFSDQLVSEDVLISLFLELDALVIREGIFPYSSVLENVADRIAEKLLGSSIPELSTAFPQSLPTWPVFAETNEALTQLAKHFRLAIISNVDDDLIAGTLTQISAPFDEVFTSQQTSTYKPDRPIFEAALRKLDEQPRRIIHIAEGLGEARPATELGMKSIWVKRSKRSDDGSKAIPHATASNLMAIVEATQSSLVANNQIKAGK
ncbi:HAD-IA family hydrolase [Pseudophaeobacter sp. EL27]|uniref:HAD-IA family hydrolase n=1 Tax=Pseudophaeobacter sp. EL27 TaxID=2107580 RepID=UPI000EFBDE4B|nr:HAD-IA family hydrolase [Pseudophaeobacter sp. EL27]